jgi:hypothetical protein
MEQTANMSYHLPQRRQLATTVTLARVSQNIDPVRNEEKDGLVFAIHHLGLVKVALVLLAPVPKVRRLQNPRTEIKMAKMIKRMKKTPSPMMKVQLMEDLRSPIHNQMKGQQAYLLHFSSILLPGLISRLFMVEK